MINLDFENTADIIKAFSDEQKCINHLEELRWEYYVVSPFDASSKVYKCSNNRYRCKNTGKYFNVKTGTLFHNSKIELQKWFIAIWLITRNNNLTSVALGKELNITQKTAWYMIKRIQFYYKQSGNDLMNKRQYSTSIKKSRTSNIELEIEEDKLQLLDWLALYQLKK